MSATNLPEVTRGDSCSSFQPPSRCPSITSVRSRLLEEKPGTFLDLGGQGGGRDDSDGASCKCEECYKRRECENICHTGMESRYLTDLQWRISHSVNIYIYRNGVEAEKPVLVHIPPPALKSMKSVVQVIQERLKMKILVGYAKRLYKMDGTKVLHPCELTMYNNYIVATNFDKGFKCVTYGRQKSPLMLLNTGSKHARVLRTKFDPEQEPLPTARRYNKGQGDELKLHPMYKEDEEFELVEEGGLSDCMGAGGDYDNHDQHRPKPGSPPPEESYKYAMSQRRTRSSRERPGFRLNLPPISPASKLRAPPPPPPATNAYRPKGTARSERAHDFHFPQRHQGPPPRGKEGQASRVPTKGLKPISTRGGQITRVNNSGRPGCTLVKYCSKATQTDSLTSLSGVQRILERCAEVSSGLVQTPKLYPTNHRHFDPFRLSYFHPHQPLANPHALSPFDEFFLNQMQINQMNQAQAQSNSWNFQNVNGWSFPQSRNSNFLNPGYFLENQAQNYLSGRQMTPGGNGSLRNNPFTQSNVALKTVPSPPPPPLPPRPDSSSDKYESSRRGPRKKRRRLNKVFKEP